MRGVRQNPKREDDQDEEGHNGSLGRPKKFGVKTIVFVQICVDIRMQTVSFDIRQISWIKGIFFGVLKYSLGNRHLPQGTLTCNLWPFWHSISGVVECCPAPAPPLRPISAPWLRLAGRESSLWSTGYVFLKKR